MTDAQIWITVGVLGVSVWLTRFLPFLLFRNTGKMPKIIDDLAKALPAAMMGLLVVYCLKDCSFASVSGVVPVAAGIASVAGLHLWKRNTILSIAGGTAVYMILLRLL